MASKWKVNSGRRRRRLAALGATAGAVLASGPAADAAVVHTVSGATLNNNPGNTSNTLDLDLDKNGDPEGRFVLENANDPASGANALNLSFNAANSTWVQANDGVANPLAFGANIGPNENFLLPAVQVPLASLVQDKDPTGPYAGGDSFINGYLGVWWDIPNSSPHFGWAQINVNITADVSNPVLNLVDYAYETRTRVRILAGSTVSVSEPSGLALLALGAAGVAAWRRRRAEAVPA